MVAFRDYLIKNREEMIRYIEVKKRAVQLAKGDKNIYMRIKDPFIKKIVRKALKEQ